MKSIRLIAALSFALLYFHSIALSQIVTLPDGWRADAESQVFGPPWGTVFRIPGTITIPEFDDETHEPLTWTISPGVTIIQYDDPNCQPTFGPHQIIVEGAVSAVGTSSAPIIFYYDGEQDRNYHAGIRVEREESPELLTEFRYCQFLRDQGKAVYIIGHGSGCQVDFEYCVFNSLVMSGMGGIGYWTTLNTEHNSQMLTVRRCQFINCGTGIFIESFLEQNIHNEFDYRIQNCVFRGTSKEANTIGIRLEWRYSGVPWNPLIHMDHGFNRRVENCVFQNLDRGIWMFRLEEEPPDNSLEDSPSFRNNLFYHCNYAFWGVENNGESRCKHHIQNNMFSNIGHVLWNERRGDFENIALWAPDNIYLFWPSLDPPFYQEGNYHFYYEIDSEAENHVCDFEANDNRCDGINDGYIPINPEVWGEYHDLDGSLTNIGPFGGPNAWPDLAYVYLGRQEEDDENYEVSVDLERETYRVERSYQAAPSTIVNVAAGSNLMFAEGVSLHAGPGCGWSFNGEAGDMIVELYGYQDAYWLGLTDTPINGFFAGGTWTLLKTDLSEARFGIYKVGGYLSVQNSSIHDCEVGIMIESASGENTHYSDCEIFNCHVGIEANAGELVVLPDGNEYVDIYSNDVGISSAANYTHFLRTRITHNLDRGVSISGGTLSEFDHCEINQNGRGDRSQGGLIIGGSGEARLLCTEVKENSGYGILMNGGVLTMEDDDGDDIWGGNDISQNSISPQIYISEGWLFMEDGGNKISDANTNRYLIYNKNSKVPSGGVGFGPAHINGNCWGYSESVNQQVITDRLRPSTAFYWQNLTQIPTGSWDLCENILTVSNSNCEDTWGEAVAHMKDGDYSLAVTDFKTVAENDECKLAKEAANQVLIAEKLAGTSPTIVRTYMLDKAALSEEPDVIFALAKAAAMASFDDGDFETALFELDSLGSDTGITEVDQMDIELISALVEYIDAVNDTTDTLGYDYHYDVLLAARDAIDYDIFDGWVINPTLLHDSLSPISALQDTVLITAEVYAEDSIAIDTVWMSYKFWPAGSWQDSALTQQVNDTTWEVVLELDSLGGGLEYFITAIDADGRVERWPSTGGYPNLNDTLSHFVSFEPRPAGYLQDTAYVYCPGVLTDNLSLARGGVLYVLPSPQDEPHILLADSGFIIEGSTTFGGTGDEPEIHFIGSEQDTIIVQSTGGDDRWQGVLVQNGLLEASYTHLKEVLNTGFSGWSGTVLRIEHCRVEDGIGYANGIFLIGCSATGSDSSYIMDVTVSDMPTGLTVRSGSAIVENVTINACSTGVFLADADNIQFYSCEVTGNRGYGVYFNPTSSDPDFEVRFENCTISLNGDTLPEIYIPDEGFLDMSDNANNTIADTSGVLFQTDDEGGFDFELGGNSFVIYDTAGTYVKLGEGHSPPPWYITGNSFSPESPNDSTFLEDWLIPYSTNKWIYTYLRLEDQMEEVVEDPGDSIQFSVKAYLDNYAGIFDADTIIEVGFKYKPQPDSTNWITCYAANHEADSLYDWWVHVGDYGGVVEYIWWAKDAHGRYLTSPWGADTTAPDEGNTSFTSFEMVEDTITTDTVTIWAPTTLTHDLLVGYGGVLYIKPWPGSSDHTITFADGVSLVLNSTNTPYPQVFIEGTESMPITIEAEDDTSAWEEILIYRGTLEAEYTTFRNSVYATSTMLSMGAPIVRLDHCTFSGTDGWLLLDGTIHQPGYEDSYLRNCVFTDLGTTSGLGSVCIADGAIEITDCWFYNNEGDGLWLYNAGLTEISGCNFMSNDWSGISSGSVVSSVDISCCEFSYNGGDTTAEVLADYSTFDFSDSSFNTFADYSGTLLEGASMSSFILDSSLCNFYLLDSTGYYIVTEDETDTMDVSGAYWYPFAPDTSIFQDFFDPDTSRFWEWPFYLEDPAECGDGGAGQSSIQRNWIASTLGPEDMVSGISSVSPSAGNLKYSKKSGKASFGKSQSKSKSKSAFSKTVSTTQRQVATVSFETAVRSQKESNFNVAMDQFAAFVRAYPDDKRVPQALSRHFISAKAAKVNNGLSRYYQNQSNRATDPYIKQHAHFLSLEAMLQEDNPTDALRGFEDIIANPLTYRDSVMAVIGAMRVHLKYGEFCKLQTRYPENIVSNAREFAERSMELQHSIHRSSKNNTIDNERETFVPTEYKLYQNYPNPFNPSTEIRYDISEIVPVKLSIYNILGQHVVTLVDQVSNSGAFRVYWDGKNAAGVDVSTGMYIYQIKAGNFTDAKKMLLLK